MSASPSPFPPFGEADWRKAAEAALKGGSLDTLVSKTADAITLRSLHPPADGLSPLRPAGPWRILARLDHPDAGEANAQALEDLAGGADGLEVVFAGAQGAHGYGLARHDSATLHRAFDGVVFDKGARFELDLGADGGAVALAFAALVERSGARPADADVAFGLDPLGQMARGAPFSRDWSADSAQLAQTARVLGAKGFPGPFAAADARSVHAAGGTPAQELAFALAAATSYLRGLAGGGFDLDGARAAIAFRLAADADQLVGLAKFRALRLLWARVEEACGLAPRPARVHAESAWRTMTARDPYVNVMRGAMAAFSAGLGGADSVCVLPHTLALGLPDALARRLARNGQLILLRESCLGFVADPAAGAGAFEALTAELCDKAWGLFQAIEAEGGLPAAIASGSFQRKVGEAAARLQRDVARLKAPITGVSAHPDLGEAPVELAPAAPPRAALERPEGALKPLRLAEPFERLRDASDLALARDGARPKVYLAAIGPPGAHGGRVGFARDLLEAGGLETVGDGAAASAEDAAQRFAASGAALACLCGSDEGYRDHAERFAAALRKAGAKAVIYAGRPGEREPALRAAGVADFLYAGCEAVAALEGLASLFR